MRIDRVSRLQLHRTFQEAFSDSGMVEFLFGLGFESLVDQYEMIRPI